MYVVNKALFRTICLHKRSNFLEIVVKERLNIHYMYKEMFHNTDIQICLVSFLHEFSLSDIVCNSQKTMCDGDGHRS